MHKTVCGLFNCLKELFTIEENVRHKEKSSISCAIRGDIQIDLLFFIFTNKMITPTQFVTS